MYVALFTTDGYVRIIYINFVMYNSLLMLFSKEKDDILSVQQKELVQKEQQKTASSKKMDKAEDRHQVLQNDLVKICQSLQKVSVQSSLLARKKEWLELDMARKEIKQKKISAALTSKPTKELASEMVDNIQLSIIDLREDLLVLESEIAEHTTKEEQVKQELRKKKKEADENKQALEELKERQERFTSALDSQSESFTEDIRQAEKRQEELDHILQEIRDSLKPLEMKSADLAEEKRQLEKEIIKKQELQKKAMSQKALLEETGLFAEMLADIQASINKSRKRLAQVDVEMEKQRAMEKHLKEEAAKKKKELDDNKQVIQELKEKHSVVSAMLEAKRKIFDCQLRQKHQSSEKLQEECKVSPTCMRTLQIHRLH